jgi:biopolymer transport protein ExbD
MAGNSNDSNNMIVGINVTPLVDITLVLLIIFIVTAKIVVTPAVTMDLPKASHTETVQMVFSVWVTRSGSVLVDGSPVKNDEEMVSLAQKALQKDTVLRAVIHADGSVPHRKVLHTLDLLKKAGVVHIAFAANPTEEVAP